MSDCNCGKFMENATSREKDYREKGLFEEARDEQRWRKKLERMHRAACLGEFKIIMEDINKDREEKKQKWLKQHPNFLNEQKELNKLMRSYA